MLPLNVKVFTIAGCLLVLSATHAFVYRAGQNQVQVKWEFAKVAHANAIIAQASTHRAQERKWGEATTLLVEALRGAQERLQDDYENTIADRDAGYLRLRGDLSGCRDQLPSDTPAAERDNGTGDSGLSDARQAVALRIGADADNVVANLTACQAYVRAIQPDST